MRKLICLFITIISVLAVLAYLHATPDDARQMKPIDDIDGYKVKFDYEGHQEIRDRVYKYLAGYDKHFLDEDYPVSKDNLGIDLYDIDGDGKDEIFVYTNIPGYCGTLGCSFHILKKDKGEMKFIRWGKRQNDGMIVHDDIVVLRNKNLGVSDILFGGDVLLQWDGKRFESDRSRPDIGKKEGYKIKFDYKAHEKERQMVYDYMAKNYKERMSENLEIEGIGIDLFDVDDDGKDEIFVYLNEPNYCARPGCSFDILKRVDDSLPITVNSFKNMITTFLDDKEEVFVLKNKNLGVFNLMSRYGNIWRWQGDYYNHTEDKIR